MHLMRSLIAKVRKWLGLYRKPSANQLHAGL